MMTEAEIGGMQAQNTKDCWQYQRLGSEHILPYGRTESMALPQSEPETCSLQNYERINVYCLKPSSL